jgi:aryl-alcohol dehydrogenase-like predicted oxidoreductase
MKYKTIGASHTVVSAIGVGCMGIGGYFTRDSSSERKSLAALELALDAGMTFIDTAEIYADGYSEELVGKVCKDRRQKIYIATKVSPEHLRKNDMISSAEASLKRLRTDYIDLYQVHWPNPCIPIEETMGALESLAYSGKIRHIGLSNYSLEDLKIAGDVLQKESLAAVQVEYNLFDRSIESSLLPYCQENGIAIIAYSPLDQGHICGGPQRYAKLEPIAEQYNATVAQLALAWLIRKNNVIPIPKASQTKHVISNAEACNIEISDRDAEIIDDITVMNTMEVPANRIRVNDDESRQSNVYCNIEDAKANIYGFTPSPAELAHDLQAGKILKAVRVRRTTDKKCGYDYELIEGRIRYWAWVIAFGGERDIPVLIRE